MAQQVQLKAEIREKSASAVRADKRVPAIVYGHGVVPISLQVDYQQLSKVLSEAGTTSLVNLQVGNEERAVIIRDVQYHPVKDTIIHADFYQVRMDETIKASVPLNFIGEAVAVKDLGGVLVRNIDEVEVEALPANMPHEIAVDISDLSDFEKVIRLSDLQLPEGVTILAEEEELESAVALVQPPRTEEELEALEEEVKEDVEDVEGVKDEEAEGDEDKDEKGEEGAEAKPEADQEQKTE